MASYFLNFGDEGKDVAELQTFLFRTGETSLQITGKYESTTFQAVKRLQGRLGVEDDGVYGPDTAREAAARFPGIAFVPPKPPADRPPEFPARPSDLASPTLDFVHQTFGHFDFLPGPIRDGHRWVEILGNWEQDNLKKIEIPQLAGIYVFGRLVRRQTLTVHKSIAAQTVRLFEDWERAGLMPWIITYEGAFAARLKKGRTEYTQGNLSNHAWGTAFDINATQNPFSRPSAPSGARGAVRELVAIANAQGFFWGGHFGASEDGMHFECAKVMP